MEKILVYTECEELFPKAEALSKSLEIPIAENAEEAQLLLAVSPDGLSLKGSGKMGETSVKCDFTKKAYRLNKNVVSKELLVRAAKLKHAERELTVIDATAGLGEDAILLAAAGFRVKMFERDKVIAALLKDGMERARREMPDIIDRMELFEEDFITSEKPKEIRPDVVYLDPMFPEREKTALVKKKFQLLQLLEQPCSDEEELLEAAEKAGAKRIVIKRPVKGPFLCGIKPDFSISGKAVRYDCILTK